MITHQHLRARIRRLEEIYHGLRAEEKNLQTREWALTSDERTAYLAAVREAAAAINATRAVLTQACMRIEGYRGGPEVYHTPVNKPAT